MSSLCQDLCTQYGDDLIEIKVNKPEYKKCSYQSVEVLFRNVFLFKNQMLGMIISILMWVRVEWTICVCVYVCNLLAK